MRTESTGVRAEIVGSFTGGRLRQRERRDQSRRFEIGNVDESREVQGLVALFRNCLAIDDREVALEIRRCGVNRQMRRPKQRPEVEPADLRPDPMRILAP